MSDVTVSTANSPVTVVFYRALTTTMTVTIGPTTIRLSAALGQHYVVLLPPLIPRDKVSCVFCLTTVPQQHPQSQLPDQAYTSYKMGPSLVCFHFQS